MHTHGANLPVGAVSPSMMRKPNLISTTSAGQPIALERRHRHPPTLREVVTPPYFVRLTALLSAEQHPILAAMSGP
jgi:hypothetical protein